ncbi:hypothetical protein LVJ94_24975 [Pendulispora rubella]|uniref:PEGA domain-containing protein n=1 Tax=Pendulispora rubella TaxID=2741070 RepID=A0ABZ2LKT3_9BACT
MIAFRRHLAWLLLAASFTAFDPSSARAQPTAPSANEQREAAEHNKRGLAAVRRADVETARIEFLQSYAVVPSHKTLWNLLLAEMDSNRPLEALRHLKKYLADPAAEPKKKERAKGLMAELNVRVGHLVVEAPDGVVILVDGTSVSNEERKERIDVTAGKHVVEAAFETGHQRREVDAPAGQDTAVTFDAPPKPPPPLVVSPSPAPEKVARASESPMPVESSHGIGPPPTATLIFGGIAVVALATGMGFSLAAQSQKDEVVTNITTCFNPGSAECSHVRDAEDTGRRNATIGWIAYGATGAWLIAGGLVWAFSPRPRERAQVVPAAGPGVAGVRVQTTF